MGPNEKTEPEVRNKNKSGGEGGIRTRLQFS